MPVSPLELLKKFGIVLYGLLAGLAAVIVTVFGAFFLGAGLALLNSAMGWFHLGETQSWLPVIFAMYAFYAGIVIGPIVWWRVSASRLHVSRKVNNLVTLALTVVVTAGGLWVFMGEQAITNSVNLTAVSDDGKFVLAQSTPTGSSTLYKIDSSTGLATRFTSMPAGFEGEASFSPDGSHVVFAYSTDDKNHVIMISDRDGKNAHSLLPQSGNDTYPRFTSDGKSIYFARSTSSTADKLGFDLFLAPLDGGTVTQITHMNFNGNGDVYNLLKGPEISSDGKQLLLWTDHAIMLYSITEPDRPRTVLVPKIPNAPARNELGSAYFSPDGQSIVFTAATQGKNGYEYDDFRMELSSGNLQKLTTTNGYASDFRLSCGGKKAVYLLWKISHIQKLPRGYQLQLLDMQTGAVVPVNITGLPK
jgi:Tol biopolymer transport system component